jgi:hypothetical protein
MRGQNDQYLHRNPFLDDILALARRRGNQPVIRPKADY